MSSQWHGPSEPASLRRWVLVCSGVAALTVGMVLVRPPRPPAPELVPATSVVRVAEEDDCPPNDSTWHLVGYERGVCTYESR